MRSLGSAPTASTLLSRNSVSDHLVSLGTALRWRPIRISQRFPLIRPHRADQTRLQRFGKNHRLSKPM
jgi:hypothetical protein